MPLFCPLNFEIYGKGKTVVFLHGFLENNFIWKKIVPYLESIRSVCIELPGHGKSPLLEEKLTLNEMADAVLKTLRNLEIDSFSLVGHSLGGYVALHIAEKALNKTTNLTLLNAHPWEDSEEKKKNRIRAAQAVKSSKNFFLKEAISPLYYVKNRERLKEEINEAVRQAEKTSNEAIAQTLMAMHNRTEKTAVLQKKGRSGHIIQGEFDALIDTSKIRAFAQENNNHFYLIKNTGHNSYDEATDEVIRILNLIHHT